MCKKILCQIAFNQNNTITAIWFNVIEVYIPDMFCIIYNLFKTFLYTSDIHSHNLQMLYNTYCLQMPGYQ